MKHIALIACIALGLVGCGGDEAGPASNAGTPAKAKSLLLEADITTAVSVKDAMAAEPGSELALVGRVQELNRDGRAIFFVVDDSVAYCGRGEEDCGCPTPWDYCCEEPAMRESRMTVELRDGTGMPMKADDLGLRLLDLIAVQGTLEKTEEGGLILVAKDGWFRRERPEINGDITWPE